MKRFAVSTAGGRTRIPHKVKPTGEVVTAKNFNPSTDISNLNQNELKFLDTFRENGWDLEKACKSAGMSVAEGSNLYKKCLWFAREDELIKAKAKVPTANYILAKDLDNVEGTLELNDSAHKSLDRMAKITGSFKTTGELAHTVNVFNMPRISLAAEQALRALADKEADAIDTTATP